MEEPSVVSGATSNPSEDASRSNSNNQPIIKYLKPDTPAPTSKFKGVVSQQNGHWGSQIYANHQRIWLGTFKSENEAAMAYDSAAIKLRNGDSHRNFPWTEITLQEPNFQSKFTTDLVLGMIKDGSYASKFSDFLRARVEDGYNLANFHGTTGIKVRQLFQKELTPSDVSKLNRLVIPKKYAVKYFPRFPETKEQNGGTLDDIELVFFDRSMRSWKFRYCYWKSSQSFVFTRGWNRFAKEKGLKPRDRVVFSAFEGLNEVRKICMIDVEYGDGERGVRISDDNDDDDEENEEALQLNLGQNDLSYDEKENEGIEYSQREFKESDTDGEDENAHGEVNENVDEVSNNAGKKGFKLFGVQII